jgi:cytochrome b6-f complex iron-sulfur subunit
MEECLYNILKGMKRRDFFTAIFKIFSILWSVGLVGGVVAFIKGPKEKESPIIPYVPIDEIKEGESKLVKTRDGPVLLIRLENKFIALSSICTHKKCFLTWDKERKVILCPCHNGVFDVSGNVISGPPPRPLPRFNTVIRGERVYIRGRL